MPVSRDESFIARTYYESMRGSFEGYGRDKDPASGKSGQAKDPGAEQLGLIRKDFDALDPMKGEAPTLGQLFEIELNLIALISETTLRERYWTIEDRFQRVVPKGVAAAFLASLPNPPTTAPIAANVLRARASTLLKTIHANYTVNLAREQLIRRLMFILAGLATLLVIISITAASSILPQAALLGLLLIIIVGMAGAMLSTIQRLQDATKRDAMVDDGIFELIGLRVGWVSIVMSIGVGGVSALFIYALVSAGLLDAVVPDLAGPASGNGTGTAAAGAGAKPSSTCAAGQTCLAWADAPARELGLADRGELFKLTVYAFASGFAERFLPDIINKIAKDSIPPAMPPTGK